MRSALPVCLAAALILTSCATRPVTVEPVAVSGFGTPDSKKIPGLYLAAIKLDGFEVTMSSFRGGLNACDFEFDFQSRFRESVALSVERMLSDIFEEVEVARADNGEDISAITDNYDAVIEVQAVSAMLRFEPVGLLAVERFDADAAFALIETVYRDGEKVFEKRADGAYVGPLPSTHKLGRNPCSSIAETIGAGLTAAMADAMGDMRADLLEVDYKFK